MSKTQEIYNTVKNHLLTQKAYARSRFPIGGTISLTELCTYKTENGYKCAIGCLIPDEAYSPTMEGHTVDSLLATFPDLKKILLPEDTSEEIGQQFLESLQIIHDVGEVENWEHCLEETAKQYGLNP